MVQCRERLALVAKTLQDLFGADSRLDHLDGDALAIILVIALPQIDHRHAAMPNLADDTVRANFRSFGDPGLAGDQFAHNLQGRRLNEMLGCFLVSQQ